MPAQEDGPPEPEPEPEPELRPRPQPQAPPEPEEAPQPQPLAGLLVIDLSEGVSGPNCTKQLADYGARVVKVEPPGGDPARRMGPYPGDIPDPERSGLFLHLNTNKESVVIDARVPAGAELVRRMAAQADIVVESQRPGTMARWGLAPADLIAAKPDLVVTSVTGFGQTGPYRNFEMTEIVAYAMGGPMNASGAPDREPVKLVGNAVLMQSGAAAAVATLAAQFWAEETGVGQHVDVATFETQNGSLDRRRYYLLSHAYSATTIERAVVVGAGRPAAGGRFASADGALITTGRIWPDHVVRMVKVIDDPALSASFAAKGIDCMAEDADVVDGAIARWASSRSARGAMREAQAGGWPVVVSNDPLLLLDDEHLLARGFWVTATHPAAGALPYCGPPFRMEDGAGWALRSVAPLLGQHTDAVLRELAGLDADTLARRRAEGVIA